MEQTKQPAATHLWITPISSSLEITGFGEALQGWQPQKISRTITRTQGSNSNGRKFQEKRKRKATESEKRQGLEMTEEQNGGSSMGSNYQRLTSDPLFLKKIVELLLSCLLTP